jgi:hypothetical protein
LALNGILILALNGILILALNGILMLALNGILILALNGTLILALNGILISSGKLKNLRHKSQITNLPGRITESHGGKFQLLCNWYNV